MDFSQLFSKQGESKNFEDVVSPQSEDLLSKMLPLLSSGSLEPDMILKLLSNNNPRLSGILQFMPLLSKSFHEPKQKSQKIFNYVKIVDYYKNK